MRILYHLPLSPYARKVRLVLAEKRLAFELRVEKTWERRPEYLAMNPAGTVPTLTEENGLMVPHSNAICEYLDEAYPDICLIGRTLGERVAIRAMTAWFDERFAAEVSRNLLFEKVMKPASRGGAPDAARLREGYAALRTHLKYVDHLAETRNYLAGPHVSLADFAAAGHLSALDFIGDVDWAGVPAAKDWYARIKSRPAFRALLADRVSGFNPPPHYADLDF